ncbi:WecB/TagA/CpsF family glycosyltransferase [Rhodopseudomonas boonkerdii]|uniref:WecB/TagA/CpsF family glycosyltransferase n=1 Tax=Rhodopseudomonas boonkerdii TaxID=475937 RepID=UPI001E352585|nr:WecB/TagA/CpsF family glycosyltransferase [Rhodopseudomonas boonkerdii]
MVVHSNKLVAAKMQAVIDAAHDASERILDERRDTSDRRTASFIATQTNLAQLGLEERRLLPDRRSSVFHRWRRLPLGGLPVVAADSKETARVIVDEALRRSSLWRFPAYLTSTNGEVTYRCAVDSAERALFMEADAIHADGMAHVFASRLHHADGLPERVATSDLFYDVAAEAEERGASMYMLGATEASNAAAVTALKARYPGIKMAGHRHGFFRDEAEEIAVCADICARQPDILWISMGVPREQRFVVRHRHRLTAVGVIKTSGGLFDFISGAKKRAPVWMQAIGVEWLWRMLLEPRRLGWRYLKTNPLALYLLLKKQELNK